eukprot:SAG11_NODE_532_length_8707_cov_11.936578_5_plen_132_part_00
MSAEKVDDIQFANPFADNTFESDFTTTETPAKAALARPNGSALTSESSVEDGMNAMETDEDAQKKKKKLQMLNGSAFNTTAGVQRWWLSPVSLRAGFAFWFAVRIVSTARLSLTGHALWGALVPHVNPLRR